MCRREKEKKRESWISTHKTLAKTGRFFSRSLSLSPSTSAAHLLFYLGQPPLAVSFLALVWFFFLFLLLVMDVFTAEYVSCLLRGAQPQKDSFQDFKPQWRSPHFFFIFEVIMILHLPLPTLLHLTLDLYFSFQTQTTSIRRYIEEDDRDPSHT